MNNKVDTGRLVFFVELYSQKVELGSKYFMLRSEVLAGDDKERVEFIENMFLKPADAQAAYVAKKIKNLFM